MAELRKSIVKNKLIDQQSQMMILNGSEQDIKAFNDTRTEPHHFKKVRQRNLQHNQFNHSRRLLSIRSNNKMKWLACRVAIGDLFDVRRSVTVPHVWHRLSRSYSHCICLTFLLDGKNRANYIPYRNMHQIAKERDPAIQYIQYLMPSLIQIGWLTIFSYVSEWQMHFHSSNLIYQN